MEKTSVTSWPQLDLPYGLMSDAPLGANVLVRSAVFSTLDYSGGAKRSEIVEPVSLAAIAPYNIQQVAGVRLSQSDADLFFWLLSRAYRDGPPKEDAWVYFKRAEAFTALGRARGGKTDVLLYESLQRLENADFSYEWLGVGGRTKLVSSVERFSKGAKPYDYKVIVDSGVAALLSNGEWLVLPGKAREQLAGDPLAKGIHAFYASHKSAYPMLPMTLKFLMGRESMQDSKWLQALQNALTKVQAATGWLQCELVQAGPLAGKVVVRKGPSRRKGAKSPDM